MVYCSGLFYEHHEEATIPCLYVLSAMIPAYEILTRPTQSSVTAPRASRHGASGKPAVLVTEGKLSPNLRALSISRTWMRSMQASMLCVPLSLALVPTRQPLHL